MPFFFYDATNAAYLLLTVFQRPSRISWHTAQGDLFMDVVFYNFVASWRFA